MLRRTALGMTVYERSAVPKIAHQDAERRVRRVLADRREVSLAELNAALSQRVAQEQLHGILADMRDWGEVTITEERRRPQGRPRVVIRWVAKSAAT